MPEDGPLAPRAGGQVYGLVTLAGVATALPLSMLREVVPCPERLAPLPVSAPGLLGAMDLRGLVVPVVDLGVALGLPGTGGDRQVVVVVADDQAMVGLLADGIGGTTTVEADELMPVSAAGGPLLFSHTLQRADAGIVSVLDTAAALRLPGVPVLRLQRQPGVAEVAAAAQAAAGVVAPRRRLTLVRCGAYTLAVDVEWLSTTVPSAAGERSVLDSELCRGRVDHRGRLVPVVDPLVLLGLGTMPAGGSVAGVVLDLDGGSVVLAVDALLDIVDAGPDDVLAAPVFAVRRAALLSGLLLSAEHGQCLVLDGRALHAEPELVALAAVNVDAPGSEDPPTAPDGAVGSARTGTAPTYLRYTAARALTTPLAQVEEVLPFPATCTATHPGGPVLGIVVHRGRAVPVLSLARVLGLPATASTCLLVVDVDGDRVAFAVDAVSAIEPLTWCEPGSDGAGDPTAAPATALGRSRLVKVGDDEGLVRELDLHALARAVRGEPRTARVPRQVASPSGRTLAAAR